MDNHTDGGCNNLFTLSLSPLDLCLGFPFLSKNTVIQVGKTLFVHAGLLPHHVEYGLPRINAEAKAWVSHAPGAHRPSFLSGADSPVWTRLYSHPDESKVSNL